MAQPTPSLAGHKLMLLCPYPVPDSYIPALQQKHPELTIFNQHVLWGTNAANIPPEEWKDVTVLVTGSAMPDAGRGELTPKLQYVQLCSAGANHIAEHALFRDDKVTFCGANGVHGPQIAEWVMATYLSFQHRLPTYRQHQERGLWQREGDTLDDAVDDSAGRCVGILGYGAIGRQVARLFRALGMNVHAYTFSPRPTPASRHDDAYCPYGLGDPNGSLPDRWFSGGSRAEVHEFLASGLDLLVVAIPLTDRTRGLLGVEELALLSRHRPHVFLSNIARGAVVDTGALIAALEAGTIAGAALDVTDPEPLPAGHPLWSAPNVTITPHISGTSKRYLARVFDILEHNLERLVEGKTPLLNQLDKKAGY